jgi:ABC-type lipoprotein release transport system permease subunit
MLKLFLWLRYLRKKKIVLLSVAAVALCVALLLVADSLFTGFIEAYEKTTTWGIGDLVFHARSAPEHRVLIDEFERIPAVESASLFWGGVGLLRLGDGDVREVMIDSIDAGHDSRQTDLRESLLVRGETESELSFNVPGHPNDIGGWVGIAIVAEPDEKTDEYDLDEVHKLIGGQVVLMTTGRVRAETKDANQAKDREVTYRPKRKVLKFRISDIFYSGIHYRDSAVYLPYDEFYELSFGRRSGTGPMHVMISVREAVKAASVVGSVWKVWERFASQQLGLGPDDAAEQASILTKEEYVDGIYANLAELRKQMSVQLLIFGVICSVAVLLIFCIFYMVVTTKQKDIAIVKSCGGGSGSVALIFLWFGGCVGAVGSALGIVFGIIVTRNINTLAHWVRVVFGLKVWRSSIFMYEKIPNEFCWDSVWWVSAAAIAACVIGAFIPAIVAARVEPVRILRYE